MKDRNLQTQFKWVLLISIPEEIKLASTLYTFKNFHNDYGAND